MDKLEHLDYLARIIVKAFIEYFPDDPGYVETKIERLKDCDRFDSVKFLVNLDDNALEIVARELSCDPMQLREVSKFCNYNLTAPL